MKKLPKDFFQNMTTQRNAGKRSDDVVPFNFSKEVLEGKKKVVCTIASKHK